jgi:putative phosphoribosyl transferase
LFQDRTQAGRALGRLIGSRISGSPSIILALPRGGVPVGYEVARSLARADVAFDIFLVRKLGVPGHEELGFGAIATGGVRVLNQPLIDQWDLSREIIERVSRQEEIELGRRDQAYRERRPAPALDDGQVVLVDDGLATGATMLAAVRAVRLQHPKRIVVAVPVASREARKELATAADEVICVHVPYPFYAVGEWYEDFDQVTDDEVRSLLRRFKPAKSSPSSTPHTALRTGD